VEDPAVERYAGRVHEVAVAVDEDLAAVDDCLARLDVDRGAAGQYRDILVLRIFVGGLTRDETERLVRDRDAEKGVAGDVDVPLVADGPRAAVRDGEGRNPRNGGDRGGDIALRDDFAVRISDLQRAGRRGGEQRHDIA